MSIHVAIVEDDASVRASLAEFIHETPGFACVAACGSAEDGLRRISMSSAQVILVDINLPGRSGVEFVRDFKKVRPNAWIIMLTVETDGARVFESLRAGATGYLVKHTAPARIIEAIREVHGGGAPMSSQVARMVVDAFREPVRADDPMPQLSPREAEILRFLACGDRSKEIADKLAIGVGTVNRLTWGAAFRECSC